MDFTTAWKKVNVSNKNKRVSFDGARFRQMISLGLTSTVKQSSAINRRARAYTGQPRLVGSSE
jgi:hypothetical protein